MLVEGHSELEEYNQGDENPDTSLVLRLDSIYFNKIVDFIQFVESRGIGFYCLKFCFQLVFFVKLFRIMIAFDIEVKFRTMRSLKSFL